MYYLNASAWLSSPSSFSLLYPLYPYICPSILPSFLYKTHISCTSSQLLCITSMPLPPLSHFHKLFTHTYLTLSINPMITSPTPPLSPPTLNHLLLFLFTLLHYHRSPHHQWCTQNHHPHLLPPHSHPLPPRRWKFPTVGALWGSLVPPWRPA